MGSKTLFPSFCILISILSACFAATTVSKPSPNPKIVIIGAGVAGIGAAKYLIDNDIQDVTILEAEPRIGGRIHTIPFGENVVELGAQYCHGENRNEVYELAADLLEHSNDVFQNISYVRSNAEKLPEDLVERLNGVIDLILEKREKEANDYEGSIGKYQREKFDEILGLPENADIDKKLANEFYANYELDQSVDEAADNLEQVSAKDYNLFRTPDGDLYLNWKDKGFIEFLRLLMKSNETGKEFGILDGRIKLGKKVSKIDWQRDDYKTLVKCEDGEEFLADHVIVTVSLGVLKANSDKMFEPKLPAEKQAAIKGIGYGSFNKIFLEFPTRFWHENLGGIRFLWSEEDLKDLRDSERAWLENVYGLNTLPYQPNVLEFWIAGQSGRNIENMPLDKIQDGVMYLLKRFLKDTTEIPEPKNITVSKWSSNPNFLGCTSYPALEAEKAEPPISNQFLANTLKGVCDLDNYQDLCEKPVLQFAGEATITDRYATVDGALESGFREGQKIHDYYAYGPASVRDLYTVKDS